MLVLFSYLLIYLPPLGAGFLFYRRQRKKQAQSHRKNPVLLYLVPFFAFTATSLVWSGLLYLLARGLGQ